VRVFGQKRKISEGDKLAAATGTGRHLEIVDEQTCRSEDARGRRDLNRSRASRMTSAILETHSVGAHRAVRRRLRGHKEAHNAATR